MSAVIAVPFPFPVLMAMAAGVPIATGSPTTALPLAVDAPMAALPLRRNVFVAVRIAVDALLVSVQFLFVFLQSTFDLLDCSKQLQSLEFVTEFEADVGSIAVVVLSSIPSVGAVVVVSNLSLFGLALFSFPRTRFFLRSGRLFAVSEGVHVFVHLLVALGSFSCAAAVSLSSARDLFVISLFTESRRFILSAR